MGKKKEYIGTVISDKMQKTAVVKILQMGKHSKYSRVKRGYIKFKAHNEKPLAKMGDTVKIIETRPLSKDKFFRIAEIIKQAPKEKIEVKEVEIK